MKINLNPKLKTTILKLIYSASAIASLILVFDITLFDLPNIQNDSYIYDNTLQFWICIYFMADIVLLWFLSDDRWKFFKRYACLFLISIPYIGICEYYELEVSTFIFYLLKFLPVVRGMISLIFLAELLINNKITSLFVSYLALFVSLSYAQTLLFYLFERPVNPDVKSYWDVLWWATMTVTTVGSNIIPITTEGKIATGTLATTGLTIFPIFTVYITTLVQDFSARHKNLHKSLAQSVNKP